MLQSPRICQARQGSVLMDPFVRKVPDYEISDGIIHIIVDGQCLCCMCLATFERGSAKAARVIAAYRAKSAEVVPLPKRSHAATS